MMALQINTSSSLRYFSPTECNVYSKDMLALLTSIILLSFTLNSGGSDYAREHFSLTFPAGVNVISFNVTIIDDNIAELAELFTLDLEIPAASAAMGVIKGSPDTATVNIIDDEGSCNIVAEHLYVMLV